VVKAAVKKASAASAAEPKPRFKAGDRVRVDDRTAVGHCRTPWYLRGLTGTVALVHGRFRDPERLAYHKPGWPPLVLYKVRFAQSDIWSAYSGPATDQLEADIYEQWLELAAAKKERRT
jgi:nitrile hydratase